MPGWGRATAGGEEPPRVVIAGGGTGGHLYPGLAVARELARLAPGARVSFAGTARGLEARVVPREGFELDVLRSAGLKGKSLAATLRGVGLLPLGAVDAWRIVSRRRPHVVLGVGGYSSGPVVLAAALRGVPTMVLEQNAVPGLANRLLARFVDAAAVTYEDALPWFHGRGFVSGNPVREGFAAGRGGAGVTAGVGPARLLVFGGSQGARAINTAMVEAAPILRSSGRAIEITHQTGARDLDRVRGGYREAGLEARVEPYLDEMAREMAWADLVVCRAGATTLAELAAAGRAAILVPLPTATDDHQRRNAEALVRAGAAEMIEQRTLTGPALAARIVALASDPGRRQDMGAQVGRFARPDAAVTIAERALAFARRTAG
jgi:UDP-N-acetylglucosamine--N-acetylmuramyl-(pentapeptide) pyrophosphoryl-undecaprenol N-acetylglucosamine transferase